MLRSNSLLAGLSVYIFALGCNATEASQPPIVKMSSSGICHDSSSVSYNRTKKYTAFDSISTCISAGGRLSKSASRSMNKALNAAVEQDRDFAALYNRSEWPHWSDEDKDCQNTRHELLISTSSEEVTYKSDKQCNVLVGLWYDPYSNDTYTASKELDLDHIIPLKFAHAHGGGKWSREHKKQFANDYDNLLLVNASLNRQKGAKGPSEWSPPHLEYRCEYIALFNTVMDKYSLKYALSEQRIVNRLLKTCMNK